MVDELCAKLRDLEGGDDNDGDNVDNDSNEPQLKTASDIEAEKLSALKYYAAFPALEQFGSPIKNSFSLGESTGIIVIGPRLSQPFDLETREKR